MHIPVLKEEVIEQLNIKRGDNFIDCTAGQGGHLEGILSRTDRQIKILAFEWDEELCKRLKKETPKEVKVVNRSYVFLKKTVEELGFGPADQVFFDLGFSMWHIKESGRGFSFQRNEELDMRYNEDTLLTAKKVVNKWPKENLVKILEDYGNEEYAEEIVEEIIEFRPIEKTSGLVKVIKRATPENYENGRIHPATKTFQALRIVVNVELQNLREALPQALEVLKVGGRIGVISFHNLEGEVVEKFFADNEDLKVITNQPITPTEEEVADNPSSRSAKLRIAEKI